MKSYTHLLAGVVLCFTLVGCGPSSKKIDELTLEDSLYYIKGTQNLFTGLITDSYPNGQKKYAGAIKDGKLNGLYQEWHANGNRKLEANFLDGIEKDGGLEWLENGSEKLRDIDAIKILKDRGVLVKGTFEYFSSIQDADVLFQSNLESLGIVDGTIRSEIERGYFGSQRTVNRYTGKLTEEAQKLVLKENYLNWARWFSRSLQSQYEVNCGEFRFDELIGVFQSEPKVAEVEYYQRFYPSLFYFAIKEQKNPYLTNTTNLNSKLDEKNRAKEKVTIKLYEGRGWKISD
jgi:hypothetical protein